MQTRLLSVLDPVRWWLAVDIDPGAGSHPGAQSSAVLDLLKAGRRICPQACSSCRRGESWLPLAEYPGLDEIQTGLGLSLRQTHGWWLVDEPGLEEIQTRGSWA